jgi:apolipoprotein N-acyltransferase
MTGFAWMQIGYTQIDMPLSGLAPVLGNHAVSGAVALTSGGLLLFLMLVRSQGLRSVSTALLPVVMLWIAAGLLSGVTWTQEKGDPITVSLIQANIPQKDKWRSRMKQPTKDIYRELTLQQHDVDLVIWPETAIPDYLHRMGPYLQQIGDELNKRNTDLVLGIFSREEGLLNSVINTDGGIYHKRHLVPLGEYIPLRSLIAFFNRYVKIPMSDIASGDDDQPLLTAAGARLGVSICFEEAFARDVLKDLPEAEILLNVSNDAWFEDSIEPHQHHTIARMRALETGQYMIRSTNTGITSLIGPGGEVLDRLPQFERAVLKGVVQPMSGSTPFVIWGDGLIVLSSSLVLFGFGYSYSRKSR